MAETTRVRVIARLDGLEPRWLSKGRSWGAGVEFLCPLHEDHPVSILFANPVDGHSSSLDCSGPLYFRTGSSFSTLTLTSPIDLGECFIGWMVDGELVVASSTH